MNAETRRKLILGFSKWLDVLDQTEKSGTRLTLRFEQNGDGRAYMSLASTDSMPNTTEWWADSTDALAEALGASDYEGMMLEDDTDDWWNRE